MKTPIKCHSITNGLLTFVRQENRTIYTNKDGVRYVLAFGKNKRRVRTDEHGEIYYNDYGTCFGKDGMLREFTIPLNNPKGKKFKMSAALYKKYQKDGKGWRNLFPDEL